MRLLYLEDGQWQKSRVASRFTVEVTLANYKYQQFLTYSDHAAFDAVHTPGTLAPHSGIYRCEGCAANIASNAGEPLPPQNHHQHAANQGNVRWRLIAATH